VTTPADLLAAELRRDGSRPLLTYYDDAAAERVELSVATTANWVAKTAHLLVDEYGVEPGDPVAIRLPLHWQTAVVVLACWSVGAEVGFGRTDGLTVTTPDVVVDGDVMALSLTAMGGDFSRQVAAAPDDFAPTAPSGADVVAAASHGLPAAARVLTVTSYDHPAGLSFGLIAPLAAGGSVVLVRDGGASQVAAHAATERVTHTVGVGIDGLPRLDG
jgi:uncharacterized protein (TIGR03089 family)